MTTAELMAYVGQTELLSSDKLRFFVRILDAKIAYGRVRFLVSPVSGEGQVWVDSSRISISTNGDK